MRLYDRFMEATVKAMWGLLAVCLVTIIVCLTVLAAAATYHAVAGG